MLQINSKVFSVIEDTIKIPFESSISGKGRVCFGGDKNLRPEFRQTFNKEDVLSYILATINFEENNFQKSIRDTIKIPYPKNSISFWESVSKTQKNDLHLLEENNVNVIFY